MGNNEKNKSILQLKDLRLQLDGKPILNGLTLELWQGHIHAIVGPNGAGKTTLAAVVMGLAGYREYEGIMRFRGNPLKDYGVDARARQGITMAWQEPARYEGLKTRDFVLAAAKNKDEKAARRALEQVGLEPDDYLDRPLDKTLSGGERKKLELASILVMKPRLALLDEPDSGIDVESLERIFDAIKALKRAGTTVVLITHSLAVLNQAEHAFLMCHGTIVDKGRIPKIARYFENKCLDCLLKDPKILEESKS